MAWDGKRLKKLMKDRNLTISKMAKSLNVSIKDIRDWINGKTPLGQYLVCISILLNAEPKYFFSDDVSKHIKIICMK